METFTEEGEQLTRGISLAFSQSVIAIPDEVHESHQASRTGTHRQDDVLRADRAGKYPNVGGRWMTGMLFKTWSGKTT